MFQIASLKIICTDSTEILFSKLGSAALYYHLPKLSFLLTLTVRGYSNKHSLLSFFIHYKAYLIMCFQMSKSRGNVVDPMLLKEKYSAEVFRYLLLREGVPHNDGSK